MGTKDEFFSHIEKGYTTKGEFITMGAAMLNGETITDAHINHTVKNP